MLHISDLDEWLWSMEWSANAVSLSLELFLDILLPVFEASKSSIVQS